MNFGTFTRKLRLWPKSDTYIHEFRLRRGVDVRDRYQCDGGSLLHPWPGAPFAFKYWWGSGHLLGKGEKNRREKKNRGNEEKGEKRKKRKKNRGKEEKGNRRKGGKKKRETLEKADQCLHV